jgi:hypothetical protein
VGWVNLARLPLFGLLYHLHMTGDYECGALGEMNGKGNQSTRRKPSRSGTMSTLNPTWPNPGSNPSHCGGKPATNCLSYGTASTRLPFWGLNDSQSLRKGRSASNTMIRFPTNLMRHVWKDSPVWFIQPYTDLLHKENPWINESLQFNVVGC